MWSKVKNYLRRAEVRTPEDLDDAIAAAQDKSPLKMQPIALHLVTITLFKTA